ncbi:MAG: polyhydroxybutyrate depolymerase [Chloroflexi bacterium]|nr:polyhydroxybutyrate depolymerase [Chloroflexota bacterium]
MKRIIFAFLALTFGLLACARSVRATPSLTDSTRTLTVGGIERSYIVHIPPSYDGIQPVPLVLDFHGGGGSAESQMHTSGFESVADEKGFIVVYPNGNGRLGDKLLTWNGGTCCGYAVTNQIDDVGFVRALITDLQTITKIDTKRIYATGLSNGGIFSYRLACDASDLIAAIGPVSGTLNYLQCKPKEPVSVIHFHGTADEHVPYNGGAGDQSLAGVPFASVKDSIDFWLKFDQCPSTPKTESFADIQHDTYANCANGTAVELYTIIDGGHAWPGGNGPAWPGGDQPTKTISATKLIWDFFAAHPKP